MSITRKMLKGMGLTEDQQDTILEAHTETVNDMARCTISSASHRTPMCRSCWRAATSCGRAS